MKRVAAIYQDLWKAIDLYEDYIDGGFLRHRPPPPAFEPFKKQQSKNDPLKVLQKEILFCQKCELAQNRPQAYPGNGSPRPKVMIICENPDPGKTKYGLSQENQDYLAQWTKAIKLDLTEDCYLSFLTRCRPEEKSAGNTEKKHCLPYLKKEIELIKPQVLFILGQDCASWLLEMNVSMEILRGALQNFQGIPAYVSFHPREVLNNKSQLRKPVWEDLKKLRRQLENG